MIILIVFSSIIEILLLSSIFPTIAYLAGFDTPITEYFDNILEQYYDNDITDNQKLFAYISAFSAFTLLASLLRVMTLISSSALAFKTSKQMRTKLSKNILNASYQDISNLNSNDVFLLMTEKISVIGPICNEIFTLINSIIISLAIFAVLIIFSPIISLCMFLFGTIYVMIVFATRKKLQVNSKEQNEGVKKLGRNVREALLGVVNIKINQLEQKVQAIIKQHSDKELDSMKSSWVIARVPRYFMEGFSILVISFLLVLFIKLDYKAEEIVPLFAVVALGSQRILPLMQQAFHAYSYVSANIKQLYEVMDFLKRYEPLLESNKLIKEIGRLNHLELKQIGVRYSDSSDEVISNFNCQFNSGDFIVFQGASGSGKSTIIRIICALLTPSYGEVLINGMNLNEIAKDKLYSKISYVPQEVQFISGTIQENIEYLFTDEVDLVWLQHCFSVACFEHESKSLDQLHNLEIGESGNKLSGGQKQRLGIVLALYKNPELLIFDEATNGLPVKLEAKIIKNIRKTFKDITMLAITHRTENLELYDQIISFGSSK